MSKEKDAFYFTHDCNARNDPNILAMRTVYKAEGYGWYWMIIEILREQADYKIHLNDYTYDALALQLQCDGNTAKKFIEDCALKFKNNTSSLLSKDDQFIWSNSLLRRMAKRDDIAEKASKSATKRWEKVRTQSDGTATALPSESDANAIKERKGKERKYIKRNIKEKNGETSKSKTVEVVEVESIGDNSITLKASQKDRGELVKEVFARIDKIRGYKPPIRKAEATSIIRMVKTYTVDQIIETWQALKKQAFWADKELSMMALEKQIGAIISNNNHPTSSNVRYV